MISQRDVCKKKRVFCSEKRRKIHIFRKKTHVKFNMLQINVCYIWTYETTTWKRKVSNFTRLQRKLYKEVPCAFYWRVRLQIHNEYWRLSKTNQMQWLFHSIDTITPKRPCKNTAERKREKVHQEFFSLKKNNTKKYKFARKCFWVHLI